MDAAAPVSLHDALAARRSAIADRWYRAVARTGFAPLGGPEVRARLLALTDRAIAALLAEPFEPAEARAIGAALAALHYLDPAALESTLVVLGRGKCQNSVHGRQPSGESYQKWGTNRFVALS